MKIHNLTSHKRISAFNALGEHMRQPSSELHNLIAAACLHNSWFTPTYTQAAIDAVANNLTTEKLSNWLKPYQTALDAPNNKTVGLVLAGNIPLVGFHDILAALLAGFKVQLKLSSDDKLLIPYLLNTLIALEPDFAPFITYTERLKDFDLVIATGSNNTSRYFEYYFKNRPHIIRKNRNSIAIIHGDEDQVTLAKLGHDLFDYFGLGCRNVSKIYFPENYDFHLFFEAIKLFEEVIHHHKYHNNYDYNKSIYLVNGDKHLDNGFLLLKEDERLASPLAVAYYQSYQNLGSLLSQLDSQRDLIQCIVSAKPLSINIPCFPLGQSQQPALNDYADGINTLEFLAQHK